MIGFLIGFTLVCLCAFNPPLALVAVCLVWAVCKVKARIS